MPMLKYEIEANNKKNEDIDINNLIISKYNDKNLTTYDLFIAIKNIGLNNVKRIIVDFESPIVNNTYRIIGKDSMISIEKNETKNIYKFFDLESGNTYEIELKIYYEDVLQNWYHQTVNVSYDTTKLNNGLYQLGKVDYKVNEEKLINIEDIPK